jgi:hypothetical protein
LSLWKYRIYFFGNIIKHVLIIIVFKDKCIEEGDLYLKYNEDKFRNFFNLLLVRHIWKSG